MSAVVYCEDSSRAKTERERSYDSHIRYLGTIKDRIRFAGPLALADGARGRGDDTLIGSLFVMDEPPSVAHQLMQADPYVQSGVWQSVSAFQALESFGRWTSADAAPTTAPLYAALARRGDATLLAADVALFGARLALRVKDAAATNWVGAAIFAAASMSEARSLVVQDHGSQDRGIEVWAVPIYVGTWTRTVRQS